MLKSGDDPSEGLLDEVRGFVNEKLCVRFCDDYYDGNGSRTGKGKRDLLLGILDRPIRVCGMVLNEGEPGGGPFWTKNSDGTVSLQIAEPSQVAPDQQDILSGGTHFNPVDLVCGLRRYDGSKFDLSEYVDPATGFVSAKSKDGKQLLAQELPGLWNGAMSKWNTVFVEVPVSTFTPVKVVTDLLRPEHQE